MILKHIDIYLDNHIKNKITRDSWRTPPVMKLLHFFFFLNLSHFKVQRFGDSPYSHDVMEKATTLSKNPILN